jgi:hypothetical protein
MPKRTIEKEHDRLFMAGLAKNYQRERLDTEIAENKELQNELADLRQRYGIIKQRRGELPWVLRQSDETLSKLTNDVNAIEKKYGVSTAGMIHDEVWSKYLLSSEEEVYKKILQKEGRPLLPGEHLVVESGMPTIRITPEYGEEMIITPDVDIRNELVIQAIEAWQKEITIRENPPPQPKKINNSRMLDWSPVWEWEKMHSQFTRKEIAKLLKVSYTKVKTKLKRLDYKLD